MKNDVAKKRILAIDILRGITIAGMILVNNPGSWGHIFTPLDHAEWIGLTPIYRCANMTSVLRLTQ